MAELLERATRERRSSVEGRSPDAPAEPEVSAVPPDLVTGGEWLPADPAPAARHRAERSSPRLLTWPGSLRSVRLSVRPTAVVGVLLVVLVAGAVLGVRWWLAEQASQPVPLRTGEVQVSAAGLTRGGDAAESTGAASVVDEGAAGEAPTAGGAPGADPAAPTAPAQVLVHVAGQVREPGVVAVDAGARVQDAVRAAGGLTGEADTSRVNLARPVIDGERIWVPRPGEDVPEIIEGTSGSGAGGGEAPSGGGGASGGGRAGAIVQVNLNTADQAALEELPGVGPVTAAAILRWRADHGQFTSPDELLEVSGIGEATLEKLRPHVTL